jgi:hypothetical protein
MVVNALRRSFRSVFQLISRADHDRLGCETRNFQAHRRRPRDRYFEALESRTLLSSTLFVTAPGTPQDATHYLTLQAALAAANTGDTIDLQLGFSPGTFISTSLTQPASQGSASIHTAAALDVGDVITIGGTTSERALVTAVTPNGPGDFIISLASQLLVTHDAGSVDATNGAQGPTIGLAVGITLTADPGVTLPFNLEIWNTPAASATVLSALNLGAFTLMIDGSASTIANCSLGSVVVQSGAHANSFLGNTFNIATGDGLSLDLADNTVVQGNTLQVTSDYAFGIVVHNSLNVLLLNNTITTGASGTGIFASAENGQSTTVDIRGNTVTSTDGTGIFLGKLNSNSDLQARVQNNMLSANAMDVVIVGDGASAGNIDLGGGTTVFGTTTTGANNLSGKSNLTVDANFFTIGLFNTSPSFVVRAAGNTFSISNPFTNALGLVADSLHIPDAAGTGLILASGTAALEVLRVTPAPITVTDSAFSGILAYFTSSAARVASNFVAVIDWGDGSSSTGTVANNATGGFLVNASHTWTVSGTFNVTLALESTAAFAVVSSPAVVPPIVSRSLSLQGNNITALQFDTFSGTVATFTDSQSSTTPADYTASIAWSDGLTTPGTITANPDGSFSISASRTFSTAGALSATVNLATADNSLSVSTPITVTVTARSLILQPMNITALQYETFTGTVATFADSKPGTTPADYTASINWSDGLSTPATVTTNPDGSFSISASRSFTTAGNLTATVYLQASETPIDLSAGLNVTVTPRTLTLTGANLSVVQSATFTGILASFTDNKPGNAASAYTASIAWSDGLTTSGTIVANANGSFSVTASRAFPDPGALSANITVSTLAGLVSASAPITATVAQRVIALTALDLTVVKGTAFSGIVATFTDNLAGTTASSYVVTVKWSDGLTSSATVSKNRNGSFAIATSRSFTKAGTLTATITVSTSAGLFTGADALTATITNKNDKTPPKPHHSIFIRLIKACAPKGHAKACGRR